MTKVFKHISVKMQAAIFGSCLLFAACENDDKAISEWTEKRKLVEEARKVEAYFSQNGRLRARLTAPLMLREENDTLSTEFPESLHVDFYDSLGRRESWLDARYGKHLETLSKVWLRDSVKVINIKGDTLTTQELWWDQNNRKFYTEKEVRISTKTQNIYGGKGMEADQDLDNLVIKHPSGFVMVNDSLSAQ